MELSRDPLAVVDERRLVPVRPDLAHIPGHRDKAEQLPGIVELGGDDQVHPKAAAVLAGQPHLLLVAAPLAGALECPLGHAPLHLLGGNRRPKGSPMISAGVYPLIRWASAFQLRTRPWGSRRKMA